MKKRIGCLVAVLLVFVLPLSICAYLLNRPHPVYETNDISDYGIVKGNYDNDRPKEFVSSFFPERIEEYFTDVTYHYKAQKLDSFAYEMFLQFKIQDIDQYSQYISSVISKRTSEPFCFDTSYQACYLSNYLTLDKFSEGDDTLYIENAKVGLILFSEEDQCVVFYALGVYDGGGTKLEVLRFFFDRFGIDPLEYEKKTTPGYMGI